MARYLFTYHGGSKPDSGQEIARVMQAWGEWLTALGDDVIDGGNPVGPSTTVLKDGRVQHDGGSNPVSGYGLFNAADLSDAINKAQACPVLDAGGSVEIAEIVDM